MKAFKELSLSLLQSMMDEREALLDTLDTECSARWKSLRLPLFIDISKAAARS
jgi:hypothetical protein